MKFKIGWLALVFSAALALLLFYSPSSTPAYARSATIPVASILERDGTINTKTGATGALDLSGWSVSLDPKRGPMLTPVLASLASAVTPTAWSAVPKNGLKCTVVSCFPAVTSLVVTGTDLYVGGIFNETFDGSVQFLNNIAKFDTSTGTWSALSHHGLNNTVFTMVISGTDLYVGGSFNQTADGAVTGLSNVAKYNTATDTWSGLQQGVDGPIYALAVSGGTLYVGGDFQGAIGCCALTFGRIAGFNGTNWIVVGGFNNKVFALAADGAELYVGGSFTGTYGSNVASLLHIAKFDGSNFSALPDAGLNGNVLALAVVPPPPPCTVNCFSIVYAGGFFSASGGGAVTDLNNIAEYHHTFFPSSQFVWSALPHHGLNDGVEALRISGSDLYVGGDFTGSQDGSVSDLNRIAHYDGTWNALPDRGLNQPNINAAGTRALAASGNNLYVGGGFSATFDNRVKNLNLIGRLGPAHVFLPLILR